MEDFNFLHNAFESKDEYAPSKKNALLPKIILGLSENGKINSKSLKDYLALHLKISFFISSDRFSCMREILKTPANQAVGIITDDIANTILDGLGPIGEL